MKKIQQGFMTGLIVCLLVCLGSLPVSASVGNADTVQTPDSVSDIAQTGVENGETQETQSAEESELLDQEDDLQEPAQPQTLFDEFDFQQQLDAVGADEMLDAVPPQAKEILDSTGVSGIDYQQMLSLTPEEFMKEIWGMVKGQLKQPMIVFCSVLGVILLCSMLNSISDAVNDKSFTTVFSAVSVVCISATIISPIINSIYTVASTIEDCSNFMATFIPVFASVVTVGGQPVTATTYTALLFSACQVISQIASTVLVPLMGIYLALGIAGNLAPDIDVTAVTKAIKTAVTWALGLLLTLFVGLLSVQTLVASSGDSVTMKTTKFLIGSFVPVVGSALSDAFVATQGYIKLLKTTIGAFGILVAAVTFLPVLLQTVIWYGATSLSAAVSDMLGVKQVGNLLRSASSTLGVLVSVILSFAILLIVCTSLVLIVTVGG